MTTETKAMEKQEKKAVEGSARAMERRPVYLPATDVYERQDAIVVVADMPGVSEKDVEINLENEILTLQGTTQPTEQEGFDALYSEFVAGDYERAFAISEDVDRERIKATMKNGVLRVELPKSEKAQPRKIAVQAE